MLTKDIQEGLTFDDVILVPQGSNILPKDVKLNTILARDIRLAVPFISAAMDTVTEHEMAIVMAQMGGIGIIHRNMSPELQAAEITKVKKFKSGVVSEPIIISPDQTIKEAKVLREQNKISGFPVVEKGRLVGILTSRDVRSSDSLDRSVKEIMTPREKLITAKEGVTAEEALKLMNRHRIEKLPLIDDNWMLKGLVTLRDIESEKAYPGATKDDQGRLRVGAAVGVGQNAVSRAGTLVDACVDVIVVDTAHGHSSGVIETIKSIRAEFKDLVLVGGNIATGEAAKALIDAGVDAVKVGVGPGSICTTRIIAGVGVPQITAIADCAKVAMKHRVPVIADGGIKYSGDVVKAIAAGADSVMMGSILAGTDRAPGEVVIYQGRSYKSYRGMGSIGAMAGGSKDRYAQDHINDSEKLVPEGIEGRVPYRGPVEQTLYQFIGGLRSGMGYTGSADIHALKEGTKFVRLTSAGLKESHVHDVVITKEAPNYRVE